MVFQTFVSNAIYHLAFWQVHIHPFLLQFTWETLTYPSRELNIRATIVLLEFYMRQTSFSIFYKGSWIQYEYVWMVISCYERIHFLDCSLHEIMHCTLKDVSLNPCLKTLWTTDFLQSFHLHHSKQFITVSCYYLRDFAMTFQIFLFCKKHL